jgi:hypothetical protein
LRTTSRSTRKVDAQQRVGEPAHVDGEQRREQLLRADLEVHGAVEVGAGVEDAHAGLLELAPRSAAAARLRAEGAVLDEVREALLALRVARAADIHHGEDADQRRGVVFLDDDAHAVFEAEVAHAELHVGHRRLAGARQRGAASGEEQESGEGGAHRGASGGGSAPACRRGQYGAKATFFQPRAGRIGQCHFLPHGASAGFAARPREGRKATHGQVLARPWFF